MLLFLAGAIAGYLEAGEDRSHKQYGDHDQNHDHVNSSIFICSPSVCSSGGAFLSAAI
jgi:hypothetical protein